MDRKNVMMAADGSGGAAVGGPPVKIDWSSLSPRQKKGIQVLSQYSPDIQNMALPVLLSSTEMTVIPKLYWGLGRFEATYTAGATPTYSIAAGKTISVYVNKFGDNLKAAGFNTTVPANFTATRAETNLTNGGTQTEDNAWVIIWGIGMGWATGGINALNISEDQQPELIKALMRNVDTIMSLSQTTKYYLGKIGYYPQAGGLDGEAISQIQQGFTNNHQGQINRVMRNGMATQGNIRKLPDPVRWAPVGKGKDCSMSVQFTVQNPITIQGLAGTASVVDGNAYPGFTPEATDIFQDLEVLFQTIEISDRSDNM